MRVACKGPTIEGATVEGAADLRASFALWSKRSIQRSPIVWISSSHTFSTFAFPREPSSLTCQLTKDQFHLFNTLGFESMDTFSISEFSKMVLIGYMVTMTTMPGYHGNTSQGHNTYLVLFPSSPYSLPPVLFALKLLSLG